MMKKKDSIEEYDSHLMNLREYIRLSKKLNKSGLNEEEKETLENLRESISIYEEKILNEKQKFRSQRSYKR